MLVARLRLFECVFGLVGVVAAACAPHNLNCCSPQGIVLAADQEQECGATAVKSMQDWLIRAKRVLDRG